MPVRVTALRRTKTARNPLQTLNQNPRKAIAQQAPAKNPLRLRRAPHRLRSRQPRLRRLRLLLTHVKHNGWRRYYPPLVVLTRVLSLKKGLVSEAHGISRVFLRQSAESGPQGKASGRSRSAFASMASLANPRSQLIPTV